MSIRLKLTIMFLAIALIPLLLVSTITFTNYKNSLEASRLSQLGNLVTFKTERIEAYLDGLKADIEIVQNSYTVKKNLPVLTRLANNPVDPEFLTAKKMLDDVLRKTPSVLGLSDIMLVNPEGKVVYSSNPEHSPKDFLNMLPDSQQKAFDEGKNKIYFSDVFLNKAEGDKSGLLITAPAFDLNNAFIGVIALEVDTAYIYRLIQDVTGLGDTGETLVGQKIGNQVVFLNPLRHDPEAALKKKINIGEKVGVPIQEAVQGREGAGQLVDYRGKKVIAAWQYIPSLDWGIVAKIDTQEAFADVVNLRNLLIILLVIISVLAGIMAFSIAQSISEPIKKLSKGAEIIGSGNLDYKIGTNLKDEIGQLSRSFAKMTQDLKQTTASRDELNKEIAERRKVEEALRQTRDYLENIFNCANAPILCWDAKSRITRFNHAFENLTNYKHEEVIGKELSILFPDDTREESLDKIGRTLIGEHWEVVEIPIRRKGGEIKIALWNSANVYADDGKTLLSTIAQGQDITERKQMENELKRSNDNLEQFAYVASHDLQEPLRMMASYSELLERRYNDKLDTDANEFIGYIVDGAKRMQRLINDLLAYSRVGRTDMPIGEIDCNSILGRVINSMMPAIEESKAGITHDDLPTLVGSDSNFIQLFQNLIGNAIKFHGPELLRVHVSTVKEGGEWVFSVRDNGIGIEPQYTDRIFLLFQRLHGRGQYPGTGIGLSICKKIVETQGGRIWVESEYGKGSTFYFTIPAQGGLNNE
jgi:PAS domain S-box-containing protein